MQKKRTRAKSSTKVTKRRAPTILHIVDWQESFEPDDATRKGQKSPLAYVKLHIKGRGPLDQQQLDLQRRLLLSDEGGVEAWSVYTLMCITAGNRGEHRGYLWNDQGGAADAQEIALMIGVGNAMVKRALRLLRARHFIERVVMPPPPRAVAFSGGGPDTSGDGPDASGNSPDASGQAGNNCNRNGEQEQPGSSPSASTPANGNGEPGTENLPASAQGADCGGDGDANGKAEQQPARDPPPTTQRADADAATPTVADPLPGQGRDRGGGSCGPGPAGSDRAPPGVAYSSEVFASVIFVDLYPTVQARAVAARMAGCSIAEFEARELGAFGSVWSGVIGLNLSGAAMGRLYERARKETAAIIRKRTRVKKTRGALFLHWLNEHMLASTSKDLWRATKALHRRPRPEKPP